MKMIIESWVSDGRNREKNVNSREITRIDELDQAIRELKLDRPDCITGRPADSEEPGRIRHVWVRPGYGKGLKEAGKG